MYKDISYVLNYILKKKEKIQTYTKGTGEPSDLRSILLFKVV